MGQVTYIQPPRTCTHSGFDVMLQGFSDYTLVTTVRAPTELIQGTHRPIHSVSYYWGHNLVVYTESKQYTTVSIGPLALTVNCVSILSAVH